MGKWRAPGWVLALVLLGSAERAAADPAASPRRARLPAVPELRLSWPISPLVYRYSDNEVTGYARPLQLFRAESLWLAAPGLRLLTFTSSERAFELDCSLTCQPVAARSLGLEGRLLLPTASPLVREPHVYVRPSSMRTALGPRATGALHVGVGGFLNF